MIHFGITIGIMLKRREGCEGNISTVTGNNIYVWIDWYYGVASKEHPETQGDKKQYLEKGFNNFKMCFYK